MNFKIGDKVLVNPHPSGDNKKYGETDPVFDLHFFWTDEMDDYVGKVHTITETEEGCFGFGDPDKAFKDPAFPPSSLTLVS